MYQIIDFYGKLDVTTWLFVNFLEVNFVDQVKGCGNDHYCCQVRLQLQGFDINLIYMKKQVLTPAIADAWSLLIVCIPFSGMSFHVHRTSHLIGIESARPALLIKLWIIHEKHYHNFAYGSQTVHFRLITYQIWYLTFFSLGLIYLNRHLIYLYRLRESVSKRVTIRMVTCRA